MSIKNSVVAPLSPPSVSDPFGALNCFGILNSAVNHGNFSTVYFAQNRINGVKVALKRVELSRMTDVKAMEDCKREIILLQQLNHPNVIKYISHFVDNHDLYIVLELASAGDLSKMLKYFIQEKKVLAEKTIWKFFSQISSGLQHMHSKRILHRDIKPANVFVNAEGIVKLGDLGLSRFFDSKTILAYSDVGTPFYMAPERIDSLDLGYNFRSDIWSLACVLYEMAALHSPFCKKDLNLHSLRRNILALDYKPLPLKSYSNELCLLVHKCLVVDPEERPDINKVDYIAQMMNARFVAQAGNKTPTPSSSTRDDSACGSVTPVNDT